MNANRTESADFTGHVVLVTGGTSGMGLATARQLPAEGHGSGPSSR